MSSGEKIAVFPGTFDPITNGHLDVIQRSHRLFDRLVVAIGRNPEKSHLFDLTDRVEMARTLMADCENVSVDTYEGLTVDYVRQIGASAILRGLRNVSDLNFEFQLALTNRAVADVETLFIMTGEAYGFTSSSLIKQIAASGHVDRLHKLVPAVVVEKLREKLEKLGPAGYVQRDQALEP